MEKSRFHLRDQKINLAFPHSLKKTLDQIIPNLNISPSRILFSLKNSRSRQLVADIVEEKGKKACLAWWTKKANQDK